jgi:hypothetical protein
MQNCVKDEVGFSKLVVAYSKQVLCPRHHR